MDEFDHLKDTDILYDLTKSSSGLVLISNQSYSLAEIDGRIKSRLFLEETEFKPYNREEILEILKDRVNFGFRPGTINDSLLTIVSGLCNGDARIGLQTLRVAANEAELKGLNMITIEEIKSAAKCTRKYRLSYLTGKLNEHQRIHLQDSEKAKSDEFWKIVRRILQNYKESDCEQVLPKLHGQND